MTSTNIPMPDGAFGAVADYIYETYPNAGPPIGAICIPWGATTPMAAFDSSGMMVDSSGWDENVEIRVGIYHDWSTGDDEGVLRYCHSAAEAIAFMEHITEDTPEGVDWAAWASLRVDEWEWHPDAMSTCVHCARVIVRDERDGWVDPEADGDDIIWRETCDKHDTFIADHEPVTATPDRPCDDHFVGSDTLRCANCQWDEAIHAYGRLR